jgi:uncharacterized protein (UPF0332 family)
MKYHKEIKALITKAERSLKAGENLLSEGDYDFAVSRFYYSMFYCAEALLLTKDMKFSKHSAVISFFGKEFIKTGILPTELHRYILRAFKERQKSDYDVLIFPDVGEAKEILSNTESFLRGIKGYMRENGYDV